MQGKPLVLLLSVLYGSAFIAGFNENLVNMALVSIMAEYGVDSVTAQWLVTGYMIVATVVVTCMAFLYRRFHVRTLFFGAAGLSIVGSAMGLVAPSFELLLVARLVQAVGTGIFIPLMMNTILVVTPKNKLGTYLSVGGCMITFGPAFAPVVCGALVTAFGWHSIFVVPIVAMAVLAVLGFFYMKNLETHEAHLDVLSVRPFRRGADRVVVRFDAADHRRCSGCSPPLCWRRPWLQCSWCASCDARIRSSIWRR